MTSNPVQPEGTPTFRVTSPQPNPGNIPEDLHNELRALGSRIRKTVTEGYITPPSSVGRAPFAKAASTSLIFRSANDALRDTYATPSRVPTLHLSQRKRGRSISEQDSSQQEVVDTQWGETGPKSTGPDAPHQTATPPATTHIPPRSIKPLRRPSNRSLFETQSLPASAFSMGNNPAVAALPTTETVEEEDDWSAEPDYTNSFKPVVF